MAKFTMHVDLDNAAFEDSRELARILHALANSAQVQVVSGEVSSWDHRGTVSDINGNTVGEWVIA